MATTNFAFTLLSGSDTAGYTSINNLINSIDSALSKRVFKSATNPSNYHVMVFNGDYATTGYWGSSLITAESLAGNAVSTGKIVDEAVTTAKIAAGAITSAKLAADSVGSSQIISGSVGTSELADGQVTTAKLAANITTQFLPSGMIAPYAGTSAPNGWLLCNGAAISRTTYADLFNVVGTTYGVGDNSTTFNLPDLSGRVPVGLSGDAEFVSLGTTGGSKTVTLTSAQSGIAAHSHTGSVANNATGITFHDPGHGHSISDPGHTHGYTVLTYQGADTASGSTRGRYGAPTGVQTNASGTNISVLGNGTGAYISDPQHAHNVTINSVAASNAAQAHTNLQPYIALNYIIKI